MRIVCPICSAAYEVRETLLAPGRTVRCARCAEEWVPITGEPPPQVEQPPEPSAPVQQEEPAAPAAPPPPLTAMERLARQPPAARATPGLRAAWAASLLVLLLFCCGLIVWRGDLMHAWPPSARLYHALGLSTPQPAQPPSQ